MLSDRRVPERILQIKDVCLVALTLIMGSVTFIIGVGFNRRLLSYLAARFYFSGGVKPLAFTEHPRLLARVAGAFYLIITAFALFAYLYVRGQVIVPSDMTQTAANFLAHEKLYRMGISAAVIVVVCNLPLGWILFELLKVVHPRLAQLALLFITVSATIEAVNLFNYISPVFIFNMPEYRSAFLANVLEAHARCPLR